MADRVAFVTGGMGGIGTAVCRRLAADGNKVVANCLPGYDKKDAWLANMRAHGYAVHAAEGSVEEFDSCADMFYRITAVLGPVDILVNNAGITRDGVFKRMSESDWYDVINTNLNSVFNVTRQVIEGMMDRGWGSQTRSPAWSPICARMARVTLPAPISPSTAGCTGFDCWALF